MPTSEQQTDAQELLLLRTALQYLDDVLLITDADVASPGPRIVFASANVERLTGYTAHELIGRSPRIFQGRGTDRGTLDRIRSSLASGTAVREDLLNYTRDGREYWVEILIAPIAVDTGSPTHYVSVQRDITERRRLHRATLEAAAHERGAIARDIHDGLAQDLAGMALSLSAVLASGGGLEPDARVALESVRSRAQAACGAARALAYSVAPRDISGADLPDALHELARSVTQGYGVPVTVECDDPSSQHMGNEVAGELFLVAQEATLNAARHSHAARIAISLHVAADEIHLRVADDGQGFDVRRRSSGLGMASMRARARSVGGALSTRTGIGAGTTVDLILPVASD